jgi:colanic acid/amylovoran biosynthesis glycosyltransferase
MRVLMFSNSYGSLTTTFIRNEVEYFNERHELLYLRVKGHQIDSEPFCKTILFEQNGFSQKFDWLLWRLDLKCDFKDSRFSSNIQAEVDQFQPEVIHCHFGYEALKLLQNVRVGIPVIIHFHGYDASQMLRKKSYVKALNHEIERHRATVVYVSNKMKSNLTGSGVQLKKARLLRYGINLNRFTRAATNLGNSEKFHLLQVSSLAEKKGHEYVLRALNILNQKNFHLADRLRVTFTGSGSSFNYLKGLLGEFELEKVVEFVGDKSTTEVVALLNSANGFLHHSVTASNGDEEGIPNAIMEAMAMELPILSSFHAGIPELVENGVNGILCEERNVESIAQGIEQIMSWPRIPANRIVIEEKYEYVKHNKLLEDIYRDVISKSEF